MEVAKGSLQDCIGWIKWEHTEDARSESALSSEDQQVLGKAPSRMLEVLGASGLGSSVA